MVSGYPNAANAFRGARHQGGTVSGPSRHEEASQKSQADYTHLGPLSPQWTQVDERLGRALSGIANWPHYESADMRSMCFAGIQQATLQHPPQKIVFVSELVE